MLTAPVRLIASLAMPATLALTASEETLEVDWCSTLRARPPPSVLTFLFLLLLVVQVEGQTFVLVVEQRLLEVPSAQVVEPSFKLNQN